MDALELRKASLCGGNINGPQSHFQISSGEMGGAIDSNNYKCLQGKADTSLSYVCAVGSAQLSGCVTAI